MDLELEVRFEERMRSAAQAIAVAHPKSLLLEDAKYGVVLRTATQAKDVASVDVEIFEFLNKMLSHAPQISNGAGVLRLGLFYDVRESVVFPLRLSTKTIKALCELGFSLDATGYPCEEAAD